MKFTIQKILDHTQLQNSRLLAGKDGVQNIITSTNMMDNPQAFDWLLEGDLVLTTGFVFKDDPELQHKVIIELVKKNCSGLAIKPRKYFGEVPEEMIALANQYHFPIIEIPQELSLAQFSNILNKKILSIQDSVVQKTLYIHEKLTEISLAGGGIKEILVELSFVTRNPILVLNEKRKIMEFQDWQQAMGMISSPINPIEIIENSVEELLEDVPTDTIPFRKSIKKELQIVGQNVVCRILPIKSLQELLGYVVVFEVTSKLERIDYIAIEKGSTIIALDILKQKEIEFATLRIRDDFFHDLLTGKIESEHDAIQLANQHNFATNRNNACVVMQIKKKDLLSEDEPTSLPYRNDYQKLEASLRKRLKRTQLKHQMALLGKELVLILQIHPNISRKEGKELLENICRELHGQLTAEFPYHDIRFGIGKYYNELRDLHRSREEALAAMEMNLNFEVSQAISHYDHYLIYELLNKVPNQEDLEYFYEDTIQMLDEYDQANNMNLVETLRTYFEYLGNIKDAASALYIHRNTMLYRMDKIMSILDMDLHHAKDNLKLQLSLYIRQILNKK